ncbi:NAD+ synthase [Nitrosomonas marina]|uniref:Glutamine-dependent NAD(+) synthetase n=1 Tax=Nitrosomonas marina TaxID=917 RepID=A0A1H8AQW7_9PROT|nr:NAD+ synthase [Nitrosomonas marina]SEM72374.1 NAD+ synthase (glutamine-hydrolysing) [Nitrosomonas marina]
MKIAIAQLNLVVGDIVGNAAKIVTAAENAKNAGADLIVTPELALSGYPPVDLLLREAFYEHCANALTDLIQKISGIIAVVGHPDFRNGKLYNAASVIQDGEVIAFHHKRVLNRAPFFNEYYYFDKGSEPCRFEVAGETFGILICADFWQAHTQEGNVLFDADVDHLLVLSASAYHIDKQVSRYQLTQQFINETGITVVHANLVGGQDELVFDGASFVMNRQGILTHQFAEFNEELGFVEIENREPVNGNIEPQLSTVASIYQALCVGVRDYIDKNNFPGVLIGLSGGIDSALTLAIAVDALGAERVQTVMLPTQYTSSFSLEDAATMTKTLGVKHSQSLIKPLLDHFLLTLKNDFQVSPGNNYVSTVPENLQARIRGTLLMALSNQTGYIVLTTGNKSEIAVGYCTLYGDMAGGFSVLKDISKTMVYQLCKHRNQIAEIIPQRIIKREPTAELRHNQTDQDSLPPYEILDAVMEAYIENNLSSAEIIEKGFSETDVHRVIHLIKINEYKRRQSPPGIRITQCDFGTTWRYPITNGFEE